MMSLEAVKKKGGMVPRGSPFLLDRWETYAITMTVAVNISADIAIQLAVNILIKLHILCIV